jgi:hypothetical protein
LHLQICVTLLTVLAFGMLTAVNLDNQPTRRTSEVDDVMVDRLLSLELVRGEPLGAKDLPEAVLCGSRLGTHLFRAFAMYCLSAHLPAASRLSLPC